MRFYIVFLLIVILFSCHNKDEISQEEVCSSLIDINERCRNELRLRNIDKAKILSDSAFILLDNPCESESGKTYYNYGNWLFLQRDYEAAIDTYKIAKIKFEEQQDTIFLSKVIGNIGLMYKRLDKYNKAIRYIDTSYQLAMNMRDTATALTSVFNKNIILSRLNQDSLAILESLKHLSIAKQYNDSVKLAKLYENIGTAYLNRKVWDKALYYFSKTKLLRNKNDPSLGASYNNISAAYIKLDNLDSASLYIEKAEEISKRLNALSTLAYTYTNKGVIARRQNQFFEALEYHQKALIIRDSIKFQKGVKETCFNIVSVLQDLKRYNEAEGYLKRAITLSKEVTAKDAYYQELLVTINFYNDIKQYKKAIQFYEEALKLSDVLLEDGKTKALLELDEKYQNQLLQKDNETKVIALKISNFRNRIFLVGFIVSLLIAAILWYSSKIINQQNEQLSKSFDKINQQNKQLNLQNKRLEKSKNVLEEEQQSLLDKVTELTNDDPISIGKSFIKPSSILYIESAGNYIHIVQENDTKKERLTVKKTVTLLPFQFVRIQKGIVVNSKLLKLYDRKKQIVILGDDRQVNVSPNHQEDLENVLLS